MVAFYKRPSDWGDRQFTPCRLFAKDPRFINMVMTFVLHPLSHYNSITEPRARFLLSLLEHFTIDFPSHFILSFINVHLDSAFRDKLIFPSAITRILRHFSAPFPFFDHFIVICAIDYASFEKTLFKKIVTGDEVLALVRLFLLNKLMCMCTVGFCDQASS